MNRKIIYFLTILISLIIIQSCIKKPTSPQNNKKQQLFPMSIGNYWDYKMTTYDSLGNVDTVNNITIDIPKDTIVSGETWYFYAYHGKIYWTTRSDGIWRWSIVAGDINTSVLYFKYPTSTGDTLIISNSGSEKTTMATISLDSLTATPSGYYNCILYCISISQNDTLRSEEYLYFALGVGWVASDYYRIGLFGSHKLSRTELISYFIK